jgi:hypothetical protein
MRGFLKSAIAHLRFVNHSSVRRREGRIARAIADRRLARSENSAQRRYGMSAQIREEHDASCDVPEATRKGGLDEIG